MENSIRNEQRTTPDTEWQPRPELKQAMQKIASIAADDDTAVVSDHEITFDNFGHRTGITASEVDLVTTDGHRISERIDICTPLPEVFSEMSDTQIALGNTLATTGAMVRYPDNRPAMLVSTLPVFETDTVALADLYTPLVAYAALTQILGPMGMVRFFDDGQDMTPKDIGLQHWDAPSFWDAGEFEYAESMMRRAGIYCNAGEQGLTAELPWDADAVSAIQGDRTSLLTFVADMQHPVAGNGLFYKLELPLLFDTDELAGLANDLNVFETSGVDVPPFFGAWCGQISSGSLSHVGFWPNGMFMRGTVANIASWCMLRSRLARQFVGNKL